MARDLPVSVGDHVHRLKLAAHRVQIRFGTLYDFPGDGGAMQDVVEVTRMMDNSMCMVLHASRAAQTNDELKKAEYSTKVLYVHAHKMVLEEVVAMLMETHNFLGLGGGTATLLVSDAVVLEKGLPSLEKTFADFKKYKRSAEVSKADVYKKIIASDDVQRMIYVLLNNAPR